MPTPVPNLQFRGWLTVPWAERNDRTGGQEFNAGYNPGNQHTLQIWVNWGDLEQALIDLLGTNLYNASSGNIDRQLPAKHPRFRQFYAERVSGRAYGKPLGKIIPPSGGNYITQYPYYLLTILFTQPKFSMTPDNQLDATYGTPGGVRQEWHRFVEWRFQPTTQTVQRPGATFKWAEGGAAPAPTVNSEFAGTLYQRTAAAELHLVFKRVPAQGLFGSGGIGIPANVMTSVEKVNSVVFLGFPVGTLCLRPPQFIPVEQPNVVGIATGAGQPAICYDVDFPVSWADPPPGGATRGHNLAPNPGGDGLWYLVNTNGTGGGGRALYDLADISNAFRMQS